MPSSAHVRPAPLGYTGKTNRYDECVDSAGRLRAPWQTFFDYLGADPAAKLRAATDACHRAIVEQDVSMNVYLGQQSGAQPWPLDAVPLLIGAGEWTQLTRGLRQRAHLLNELLRDLYGPQKLLREGLLPATLGMANPHFLRACAGLGNNPGPFLHTYAVDLARSPDGQWWVIEDRLDAPSGLGYSLQNRIIARQALADVFHRAPVERLHQFFRDYRGSLEALSPNRDSANIALLSPGPANETYFEQAYLARYLGYNLVEGGGPYHPRRPGVPPHGRRPAPHGHPPAARGLRFLRPARAGAPVHCSACPAWSRRCTAAGSRFPTSSAPARWRPPALLAFLQPLCRQVLGEELQLPSAGTWWGGQAGPLEYILDNLHSLVVKPVFRTPYALPPRYGARMGKAARTALADEIRARPWAWCGQERVLHGTTPGWHEGHLRPMPFITRVFLAWHDGDYILMPGALTRCNPKGEDMIVSLQQGSISKDTWVLHDTPVDPTPIHLAPARTNEALRHSAATPSRSADNLFWLGRYLERCSHLVRQLEKLDPLLRDDIAMLDPGVAGDALGLLLLLQDTAVPPGSTLEQQAALVRRVAGDRTQVSSLAANLHYFTTLLERIRVTLPPDSWALVRQLRRRPANLDAAACSGLRQQLTAFAGLITEAMPRDPAWRFLDLGRRIERGTQLLALLRALLHPAGGGAATEFRLQSLLHLADGLFTYRSVFHGALDSAAALDWLILSPENPRGLRYQLERLHAHLATLPEEPAPVAVGELRTLAFRLLSDVRLADLAALSADAAHAAAFFTGLRADLAGLSDGLGRIYFSHAAGR